MTQYKGYTSVVDCNNGIAIKMANGNILKQFPNIINNEINKLQILQKYKYFPSILSYTDNSIAMQELSPLPLDFSFTTEKAYRNLLEIFYILVKHNISHNDILKTQFLMDGNSNLVLIDFGWSTFYNEAILNNLHHLIQVNSDLDKIKMLCNKSHEEIEKDMVNLAISKVKAGKYAGSTLASNKVYQGMPILDFPISFYRSIKKRVDLIGSEFNFNGKKGMDLSSSNGGLSTYLAKKYKTNKIIGVDIDTEAVTIARMVSLLKGTKTWFYNDDIVNFHQYLPIDNEQLDFTIWFNSFMWVLGTKGISAVKQILKNINSKVLFFQTATTDGLGKKYMAENGFINEDSVVKFILKHGNYNNYNKIKYDGIRDIYFFKTM